MADLNADTRREAVALFVEWAHAEGEGAQLRVVENQRGRLNKVVFGEDTVKGWYCYLRRPIAGGEIERSSFFGRTRSV